MTFNKQIKDAWRNWQKAIKATKHLRDPNWVDKLPKQIPLFAQSQRPERLECTKRGKIVLCHAIKYLESRHLYRAEKVECQSCNGTGKRSMRGMFELVCDVCKGRGVLLLTNYRDPCDLTALHLMKRLLDPMLPLDSPVDEPFDREDARKLMAETWEIISHAQTNQTGKRAEQGNRRGNRRAKASNRRGRRHRSRGKRNS